MDAAYIDELIGIQRDGITSSRRWSRFLIVGGLAILALALISWILEPREKGPNLVAPLVSVLGTFVSACSLLPYKEIPTRRIKLARFMQLRRELERIRTLPEEEVNDRLRQINKYLVEFE